MNKKLNNILFLTIFISGFCALSYQMVWLRSVYQVFGIHVYSTSAVLTAFMAGLALGSYYFGKISDRVKNPLYLYIFIEAGIFIYAISFDFLFDFSSELYLQSFKDIGPEQLTGQIIKFLQSFILLIIPTTLMGGTIPVVTKILVTRMNLLGKRLSLIYALNNFGAAAGGIIAGFFIIRLFGIQGTILLTASLNLINTLILFLVRNKVLTGISLIKENSIPDGIQVRRFPEKYLRLVLIVFGLEGFTTLAYEILWTRIFIEFSYDKTVYIYSVIIVGFIFGLSLGSILIRKWINRFRDLSVILAVSQVLIGIISFGLLLLFIYLSPILVQQRASSGSWLSISGKEYLLIFIMLTLPVTLMGFTFPLVGKITSEKLNSLGSRIGIIGFLDTVGSIFGAFIAGFIMIPVFGIYRSFILIVIINILLGLSLLFYHPEPGRKRKAAGIIAMIIILLLILAPGNSEYFKQRVRYYPEDKVISYAEGVAATVSVHELPSGHKALAINGSKTAFSTAADLKVHTMLAYTPMLLSSGNSNAFVIGFGMGVTANCLAESFGGHIDLAELSPEVVNTSAKYFNHLNENVLENSDVSIHYEDGRSFLLRSEKVYDLITSNAVHARHGANLYTTDFYEICSEKLSENGYMCQWLPTNWLSSGEFKSLVRSFTEIFPNTQLWYVTRGHMLLLGTKSEERINYQKLRERFTDSGFLSEIQEIGIFSPEMFCAHLFAGDDELRIFAETADLNTDNHPIVEFSRVTDLRPNPEILMELGKMNTDFKNSFVFEDKEELERILYQLKTINQSYKNEILTFSKDFYHLFESSQ